MKYKLLPIIIVTLTLTLISTFAMGKDMQISGGAKWCQENIPTWPTCIPIKNSSLAVQLYYNFTNTKYKGFIARGSLESMGFPHTLVPSEFAIVKNDKTGKIIFRGNVKNKVGLICTDTQCKDWL